MVNLKRLPLKPVPDLFLRRPRLKFQVCDVANNVNPLEILFVTFMTAKLLVLNVISTCKLTICAVIEKDGS